MRPLDRSEDKRKSRRIRAACWICSREGGSPKPDAIRVIVSSSEPNRPRTLASNESVHRRVNSEGSTFSARAISPSDRVLASIDPMEMTIPERSKRIPSYRPEPILRRPHRNGAVRPGRDEFGQVRVTGPPGFEPGFEAPEASVMSKLYYGPALDITGPAEGVYGLFG
jgi:hypothetical protein